jgi:hypothetical protein
MTRLLCLVLAACAGLFATANVKDLWSAKVTKNVSGSYRGKVAPVGCRGEDDES